MIIECQQALLARSSAPGCNMLHYRLGIEHWWNKYPAAHFHGEYKLADRALQQNRSQRPAQHDYKRSSLNERRVVAPFECLPTKNSNQCNTDTNYAIEVHAYSLSRTRSRAIA